MTACSACRSILPEGVRTCPNCSLPITAFAMPVARKQTSVMTIALLLFAGIGAAGIVVGKIIEAVSEPKRVAAHKALLADLHSGKLSSAEAFQARCGKPLSVHQERNGVTLVYWEGYLHVKLEPNKPVAFLRERAIEEGGKFRTVESPVSDDFALSRMSCEQ